MYNDYNAVISFHENFSYDNLDKDNIYSLMKYKNQHTSGPKVMHIAGSKG